MTAAGTAAVLSALVASAAVPTFSGITVAALLGLIVGGPVAWIVRDLTRVVEHKARF
jgi:hypothetical protein